MAKILIISGTVPAGVIANLALAQKLKEAGHNITCASQANVKKLVESRGQPFFKLDKKVHPPYVKRSFFGSLSYKDALAQAVEKIDDRKLAELVDRAQPDLVLIDHEQSALTIQLTTLNVPFVILSTWFTIWKHPNLPPLHNVAIPGHGWRGSRIMIDLLWRKYWLTQRIRNVKEWLRNGGISRLTVFRAYSKKHNFSFREQAEPYMWLWPFSFKSFQMITSVAQELDLPHTKPANYHYLGPILDLKRVETAAHAEEVQEINLILASLKDPSNEKKLIYASTSSIFEGDIPFFKKLIEAIKLQPNWELVLALGKKIQKEDLGNLPANVHAFNWVPQLQVLEHADVAITHAGINTVNECLYFGVPMLVYSGAYIDQNGTAARIAYHDLGIIGSKATDDPAQIKARIEQVLVDESIHASVEQMRQVVHKYADNDHAVKVVEQLVDDLNR